MLVEIGLLTIGFLLGHMVGKSGPNELRELAVSLDRKAKNKPSRPALNAKFSPQQAKEVGATHILKYKDSSDQISFRRIILQSFDPVYLEAYCCERNDNRTFRIDRIVEITDVNTGVIYDDGNSFVLAANAAKKIIEQAFGERLNELTVLMSIARADRRVTVEEIKLAYDWFASKASMEVNEAEFARYASTLKPDLSKFTKALIKLKTDTQAYAEIKDLAYKMAKIDGKITPKENEILSLLN